MIIREGEVIISLDDMFISSLLRILSSLLSESVVFFSLFNSLFDVWSFVKEFLKKRFSIVRPLKFIKLFYDDRVFIFLFL